MGDLNLIAGICSQIDVVGAKVLKKFPEAMYMIDVQKAYWETIRDAHDNGKKVCFFGGPVPLELYYAFDVVPFFMDMMPTRIANTPMLIGKYIDAAEKYMTPSMCNLNKTEFGAVLCGDYGVQPDMFCYPSVPCDSSRLSYPAMDKHWGIPTYCLDVPFRHDERSYQYLADQYDGLVKFLEEHTGKKLDWDKFEEAANNSNICYDYLVKIADLRKLKPCPLPGRLLLLNEMVACFSAHPACIKYLKTQYEIGLDNVKNGIGAVKEEKYRVSLLQNMVWSSASLLDWLETQFGAVVVMDGFGYQHGQFFEKPRDKKDVFLTLARKAMSVPMIHGASGPTAYYVKMVDEIMDKYSVNVSMFVGHIGCRHTWASAKIITDMVQEKYGLPTLYLELDAVDGRYKSLDDIKAEITEYMETVVMKQTV